MKKSFLALLGAIAFICGCDGTGMSQQQGEIQIASSSKDVVKIDPDGGKESVRFSSALDWYIECSDEWVTIDPMEGGPGPARISISAAANETDEARQAVVNICSEGFVYPLTVTQEIYVPEFELLQSEREFSCLGGELTVTLSSEIEYEVVVDADWLKEAVSKSPRKYEHQFTVEENTAAEPRTAVISFVSDRFTKEFTLIQRAAGTSQDDWKIDEFVHRSLAMRFTGDWCGYCPYMATAFDSAKRSMGGLLELVSLHGGGSKYDFSGTTTLTKRFSVTGFPTGIVDARASIPNYQSTATTASVAMDVAKETQATYPARTGIALSSTLNGTALTVDLSLYVKEADDYKVVVLVLEDGIVGYQNGAGNNYTHNDTARLALTSISGDSVKITEDGTIWNQTYTADLNSKWVADNLKLLVYVEKPYGSQSAVKGVDGAEYGRYGDTYVDNCRVVKVGETVQLELN